MLQVTLTFNSVAEAAAALARLNAEPTVQQMTADLVAKTGAKAAETTKAASKPAAQADASPKPTAAKPTEAPAPSQPTAEAAKADAPATIAYPALQKAVFELAARDRNAVTALMAECGVSSFKDLADDARAAERAPALAKVQAKLAELEAAVA